MKTKSKANEFDKLIGERLRARRRFLKMSQQDLGNSIGITFQQIQKYENGTNKISASTLLGISQTLETSIEYFYGAPKSSTPTDPFFSNEALKLLAEYCNIKNEKTRKALYDLIKSISNVSY